MNVSNTSKLFTLKQRGPLKTVFPSSRLFISLKQPSISSQGCFALKTETRCAYGEGNVSLPLDLQQGHTIQSSLSQDINQKYYSRVFLLLFISEFSFLVSYSTALMKNWPSWCVLQINFCCFYWEK